MRVLRLGTVSPDPSPLRYPTLCERLVDTDGAVVWVVERLHDRRGGRSPLPPRPGPLEVPNSRMARHQLSTDLVELPGGHLGYLGDPQAFAPALRPVLRALA